MEKKFNLIDCLNAEIDEQTVIILLGEYFEFKYGDYSVNLFDIKHEEHFDILKNLYGFHHTLELAKRSNFGFVIAGDFICRDATIAINEDNYKAILNEYIPYIEDEIRACHKNNMPIKDIQKYFGMVDVVKFLYGDDKFIVEMVIDKNGDENKTHKGFNSRSDAEGWILLQIAKYMGQSHDCTVEIKSDSDIFLLTDLENKFKLSFNFA